MNKVASFLSILNSSRQNHAKIVLPLSKLIIPLQETRLGMATIELKLSAKVHKETGRSEILIRLYQGSKLNIRAKSGVFVNPDHFEYYINREATQLTGIAISSKITTITKAEAESKRRGEKRYVLYERGEVVVKNRIDTEDRIYHIDAKSKIERLRQLILNSYEAADKKNITSEWMQTIIDRFHHPDKYLTIEEQTARMTLFEFMEKYLEDTQYSFVREKNFRVLIRALNRYELYTKASNKDFNLNKETITDETINDFRYFLKVEHQLYKDYTEIFEAFPALNGTKRRSPQPEERGNNTIVILMKKFKAFWAWMLKKGITKNNPFLTISIGTETYGTPYYINLEERNTIADFDLSAHPALAIQRDIFIFQCCIGCRVSDLIKMTKNNVIREAIEYFPTKTKDERPVVVRVPLNNRAKALIEKYKDVDCKGKLFPFISPQKYNDNIKAIFRLCGITRLVTILNTVTGDEVKRPINEVASSHMARRCFVGNLYQKVKDPNLIASMSGHVEGSKAFNRYREINDTIKIETVHLLD